MPFEKGNKFGKINKGRKLIEGQGFQKGHKPNKASFKIGHKIRNTGKTRFQKGSKLWVGKKHREETKKKISEKQMGRTPPKSAFKAGTPSPWKGKKRPEFAGEKHPNWKGGISRDKHGNMENLRWRADVFQRDNWTCQTCQKRGIYLEAHHIKSWANYPDLRYELENGVTLCRECHKLTNNYKGRNKSASN